MQQFPERIITFESSTTGGRLIYPPEGVYGEAKVGLYRFEEIRHVWACRDDGQGGMSEVEYARWLVDGAQDGGNGLG